MAVEDIIPFDAIADSIPAVADADMDEAIWHRATQFCHGEMVHVIGSHAEGRAWFIAVPTQALAALGQGGDALCPLACALPGHPDHQGDGGYMLTDAEQRAFVIIRSGTRLRSYGGHRPKAIALCSEYGVPPITVTPTSENAWPWTSYHLGRERTIANITSRVGKIGWRAAAAALALPVLSALHLAWATSIGLQAAQDHNAHRTTYLSIAKQMLSDPLAATTTRLRAVGDAVGDGHGLLRLYHVTNSPGALGSPPTTDWAATFNSTPPADVIARIGTVHTIEKPSSQEVRVSGQ